MDLVVCQARAHKSNPHERVNSKTKLNSGANCAGRPWIEEVLPVLLRRFAPIVFVGKVVNGQCPTGGDVVDRGVVVCCRVEGCPCGKHDFTVFGDVTLAFAGNAQARAQSRDVGVSVLRHAAQDVLGHVDRVLAVQVGLNHCVFAFRIESHGARVKVPPSELGLCADLQALVMILTIDFAGVNASGWYVVAYNWGVGCGRASDIKPCDLPSCLRELGFDADLSLCAFKRGQGLACVGVAQQGIGVA